MKQKDGKLRRSLFLLLALILFLPWQLMAQNITVKGVVLDSNGETVIGASVVEKGKSSNGTITDLDGNFTLNVSSGKMLVVSYVGMETQEVKAVPGRTLKIVLQDDSQSLDEVVVIGYGSRARRDLTGSVGSVSGKALAAVPVTSAAVALQGKIAGVQVTTVDGAPGADINIRVRGGTSVTQSNEPLYIVDGFQADNINDIPPTDIASIDVLKDASLTAIYGAKGGNGVVIVTTKAAQAGKITVNVNSQLSYSYLSKRLDVMDAADFVRYQYDWAAAGGSGSSNAKFFRANFGNPKDLDIYQRAINYDWQEEVMSENPINYSTNVTIGGGNDRTRFNLSLTQSDDKGIILGSGVRRTNLNFKLNVKLAKNLTLNYNPKFSYRRDIGAGGDNIGTGGIIDVLRYRPTNGLREFAFWDPETVDPDDEAIFEYSNPRSDINSNTQKKHSYSYTNQLSLDWTPIKGLTFRTEAALLLKFSDQERFYGAMTDTGQSHNSLPVASISTGQGEQFSWTNTLNYNFTIKGLNNLSFLLGQEIRTSSSSSKSMTNRYFPKDIDSEKALNNMSLGTPYTSSSSLSTPDRMASFFGQFNYNYDKKYLLSLTMRADGSTKFSPGNQWGYFPSISGGWVISKESFMEYNPIFSNLKLRAAVGLAGNNRIGDDMWRYLYSINSTGGPGFGETTELGEQYYSVSTGSSLPNPDIKWETTITRNVALDMSLFGDRLTITPELYWNTTRDLLYTSNIPSTTGFTSQIQNIGQVTNRGFELSVSGDILRGKDYVLSANLTFGMNKMVVDKLNSTDDILWMNNGRWSSSYYDYCLQVGSQVGLIYGFVYDGLYSPDEFYFDPANGLAAIPKEGTIINEVFGASNSGEATLPGKIKLKDLDGNGIVDENDRTVIGNTNPKFQGGFGLSGQWKGFDFTANFNYMYDFDINNATAYQLSSSEGNKNNFYNVLGKFTEGWHYTREDGYHLYKNPYIGNSVEQYLALNENAKYWNPADVVNKVTHSYFIEDGSFLRCQNLTIGYTLPDRIIKKCGMSRLRFYLSATNLFIITGYSGFDPEVDIQTGLTPGMDYNRYPRNRSFIVGTNITF